MDDREKMLRVPARTTIDEWIDCIACPQQAKENRKQALLLNYILTE